MDDQMCVCVCADAQLEKRRLIQIEVDFLD